MGKVIDTIHVPLDKAKEARRRSRATFGKAGVGRKTSHKDRKKDADKRACRKPTQED
ncbi:MAG: hypothetical protein JO270_00135 [Acidobacteriaceae bacterium]|nr:hypothetical protein [Acidobacteriaceae bacterium]